MSYKSKTFETPSEKLVRGIRRVSRKRYLAEETIRIVLDGLRSEATISELCRRGQLIQTISDIAARAGEASINFAHPTCATRQYRRFRPPAEWQRRYQ